MNSEGDSPVMRLNILVNDFGHLNPTSKAACLTLFSEVSISLALIIRNMLTTEYIPHPTSFLNSEERYLGEICILSARYSSVISEE